MIREMLVLGAAALLQSAGVTGPVGFRQETLRDHRVGGDTSVETPANGHDGFREIEVTVTIGTDGIVTDARAARTGNRDGEDPAPALAAARAPRVRPLTYRGHP